jgi:hypothetical protein
MLLTIRTPQPPSVKKGAYATSPSTQHLVDQPVDDTRKGAGDKDILADPSNSDKKLHISTGLDTK